MGYLPMPRKYIRKTAPMYETEDLRHAHEDVTNKKLTLSQAATKFSIPKTTPFKQLKLDKLKIPKKAPPPTPAPPALPASTHALSAPPASLPPPSPFIAPKAHPSPPAPPQAPPVGISACSTTRRAVVVEPARPTSPRPKEGGLDTEQSLNESMNTVTRTVTEAEQNLNVSLSTVNQSKTSTQDSTSIIENDKDLSVTIHSTPPSTSVPLADIVNVPVIPKPAASK
ncbi:glutaconyl-CoA decarboxylase subunit gamma-like [Zerene cesonia]|uniref:glutaconyl-CoA decarboxylase subunit gamma-like n=1 Tax=Zerene cesonia TaxID=33412 RepID=UPI0018E53AAC|nr:glutaconyl-CoA decarboxylase subunit gamma-like [Zerene cesonia]